MRNPKLRRPNGLPSVSTKVRVAAVVQALAAVALVTLTGEVTVETLTPGITALVSAVLAFFIKDSLPAGSQVEYEDGGVFEV